MKDEVDFVKTTLQRSIYLLCPALNLVVPGLSRFRYTDSNVFKYYLMLAHIATCARHNGLQMFNVKELNPACQGSHGKQFL